MYVLKHVFIILRQYRVEDLVDWGYVFRSVENLVFEREHDEVFREFIHQLVLLEFDHLLPVVAIDVHHYPDCSGPNTCASLVKSLCIFRVCCDQEVKMVDAQFGSTSHAAGW